MCAAARAPKAADGRHFALPPPISDRTGGANHGPMTAKFAGVRRFRLGVVNLPHTRRRALHAVAGCGTALILRDARTQIRFSRLARVKRRSRVNPRSLRSAR